jgi:hypothetical protein
MTSTINIVEGQTIFDVALQHFGSIEGVFELMEQNGLTTVNADITAGDKLKLNIDEPIDKAIATYFKNNQITVSSGFKVTVGSFNSDFNSDFN